MRRGGWIGLEPIFFTLNIWILDCASLNVLKTATQLHIDRLQVVMADTSMN